MAPTESVETFTPKDPVDVSIGRYTASLYPKVTHDMPNYECAYAYHLDTAALRLLPISPAAYLDALGNQLNVATIVDGNKFDWINYYKKNWCNFDKLTILTFHNSAGTIMPEAVLPNNSTVLKPTTNNLAAGDRRPADVHFVRVKLDLDFTPLMREPQPNHILSVEYYIELPQDTRQVIMGNGQPTMLTTWHGVDDLSTLTVAQVRDDILNRVTYADPIELKQAAFNVTNATIDNTEICQKIEKLVLTLAIPTIERAVFDVLCPDYSIKPHAVLENIKQYRKDAEGNTVSDTFKHYCFRFNAASRPFANLETLPLDACSIFMQGMEPDLKSQFVELYPRHAEPHDRDGRQQRLALAEIQRLGAMAESKIKTIKGIIGHATGQTFHTGASYPSQAERTLQEYQGGRGGRANRFKGGRGGRGGRSSRDDKERTCDGCGRSDHLWSYRGKIVCPDQSKPGIYDKAMKARKERTDSEVNTSRQLRLQKRTPDFEDLSEEGKKKMYKQVMAASQAGTENSGEIAGRWTPPPNYPITSNSTSPTRSPTTSRTGGDKPPVIFMYEAVNFNSGPRRPMIPVQINMALPHANFVLGPDLESPDCPTVACLIDSAASLNTANLAFALALSKAFPHCVSAVYTSDNHSPVVLSGIVMTGDDAKKTTAELPVAFEFHLPYRMTDGSPTKVCFGCGPDVSVNMILGLPFVLATKMVIDVAEGVAECRALDCNPFQLDFRRARVDVPKVAAAPKCTPSIGAFLQDLEALEKHWSCVYNIDFSNGKRTGGTTKRARFAPETAGHVDAAGTVKPLRFDLASTPNDVTEHYMDPALAEFEGNDEEHENNRSEAYTSNQTNLAPSSHPCPDPKEPIRVAAKGKKGKRRQNVFIDDRGFPDQSNEFDYLLHHTGGSKIIRKRLHPAPSLDVHDPQFHFPFEEATHGEKLRKELKLDHLPRSAQLRLTQLIKKYWTIFDERGLFTPVRDYECVIDTGSARPITVSNINYGPRETPIMNKCIAALLKLGHIEQTHTGQWLFKALLAPKPHQEHITDIADFVWRFCVNFIPLNSVTKIIAYPIPRCDSAVMLSFGKGKWFWLKDAPSGYNQLAVAKSSREKLAFAGPNAIKYQYRVMPFGPVNGPVIFIAFMHDLDGTWKELAESNGLTIDDDTNTKIIVDDVWSWAKSLDDAFKYMECQFRVCLSQRLSLSLKKCFFFPKRVEFVGIDVSDNGNRPAMSKHELLKTWPQPTIVRDIASFIGFAVFYSVFIPWFELRVTRLREIMLNDYTTPITSEIFDETAKAQWADIQTAILSDPCLKRFDHKKRLYLATDASSKGFGYVALQPANDDASISAMTREMAGGACEFLAEGSNLALHPVAFGSRKTRGKEPKLHSYLCEGFSGDYAMGKCRHMCWGMRYTWITDCYGIRFILTYDGPNDSVQRLQMRFMCQDMDIVHRNRMWLTSPDYFSYLGADLCFDPLARQYAKSSYNFRNSNPLPESLPMQPDQMPGFRGPRIKKGEPALEYPDDEVDATATNLMSTIIFDDSNGHDCLSHIPVVFGTFENHTHVMSTPLYNANITEAAFQILKMPWAVYGFNSGHFISSIQTRSLPFEIVLAADVTKEGRALFTEFTNCQIVKASVKELYHHVRASGDNLPLSGYLIHSQKFASTRMTVDFWQLQLSLIVQLRKLRSLGLVLTFIPLEQDCKPVTQFCASLRKDGWLVTSMEQYCPTFGDSVASRFRIVVAVHKNTQAAATAVQFRTPPQNTPPSMASYVWPQFNVKQYAVSYAKDDSLFNKGMIDGATAAIPADVAVRVTEAKDNEMAVSPSPLVKYFLHPTNLDCSIRVGAAVLSLDHLCPPYESQPNRNIFQSTFGIEYMCDDHKLVRPFSPFELVRCHALSDDITHKLSHPSCLFLMDGAVPAHTSAWVLDHILERLIDIRNENCEVFDPARHAAPAAAIQAFVNGAIGARLPSVDTWKDAYNSDEEMRLIRSIALNPSTANKENLMKVDANFRSPLRNSMICIENDFLVLREQIGMSPSSYVKLRIVPPKLREIIFISFHANPVGGHFNPYRTYSRIRLRYYWPGMFRYCQNMCRKCPGCALANGRVAASSELQYGFPITAPFNVLFLDGYSAGDHSSFDGHKVHLIACDGMTTFAVAEPVRQANSKTLAKALMKIMLRFGICHTVVLDKDSKFFKEFRAMCDLLNLNVHVLSGDNHKGMLVERVNKYLNKGLRILTNERDSVRTADESILLLIYGWNSIPIPGTDLSRSLVAVGREFNFPVDISTAKHLELTSTPASVRSYAKDLAVLLEASRKIAKVLLEEQRTWHRELVNSRRPNPKVWNIGDIVFARRQTRSDKGRGIVGKLQYPHTGPWRICARLDGASYELEHCLSNGVRTKKHASHLSPFPLPLVPFEPVDGPDSRYSQINRPIKKAPFESAGINGFEPLEPFQLPTTSQFIAKYEPFHWLSLSELNDEMAPLGGSIDDVISDETDPDMFSPPAMYTGPPPVMSQYRPPRVPDTATLSTNIVKSIDRLFFISHEIPNLNRREWRLVRVNLEESMALRPTCLNDGRYLVEFYVVHSADIRYNATNQRLWLQYHLRGDLQQPSQQSDTHLIRPSDTSEQLAARHNLSPFRQWITLTHESTYILGPFEFASIHGRKSRDRITLSDWETLHKHSSMFTNDPPSLALPTYSIHIDRGVHLSYSSTELAQVLFLVTEATSKSGEITIR